MGCGSVERIRMVGGVQLRIVGIVSQHRLVFHASWLGRAGAGPPGSCAENRSNNRYTLPSVLSTLASMDTTSTKHDMAPSTVAPVDDVLPDAGAPARPQTA